MLKQDRGSYVVVRPDGERLRVKRVQSKPGVDINLAIDKAQEGVYPSDYFYKPSKLITVKSNICSAKCLGCGLRTTPSKTKGYELSDAMVLDLMHQAYDLGIIAYLGYFAAEPFDNMDFGEFLLKEFKGKMDCHGINTSGNKFTSQKEAERIFGRMKDAGWTETKYVLPFLAISVGMQQKTVPLQNIVHGISAFRSVFAENEATIAISYYKTEVHYTETLKQLYMLYHKMTKRDLEEDVIIKAGSIKLAGHAEKISGQNFKYLPFEKLLWDGDCYERTFFTFIEPTIYVEADGLMQSCSCGFANYPHAQMGNVHEGISLREGIDKINNSTFFRMLSEGGTTKIFEKMMELEPQTEGILRGTKFTNRHQVCLKLHQIIEKNPKLREFFKTGL